MIDAAVIALFQSTLDADNQDQVLVIALHKCQHNPPTCAEIVLRFI